MPNKFSESQSAHFNLLISLHNRIGLGIDLVKNEADINVDSELGSIEWAIGCHCLFLKDVLKNFSADPAKTNEEANKKLGVFNEKLKEWTGT